MLLMKEEREGVEGQSVRRSKSERDIEIRRAKERFQENYYMKLLMKGERESVEGQRVKRPKSERFKRQRDRDSKKIMKVSF